MGSYYILCPNFTYYILIIPHTRRTYLNYDKLCYYLMIIPLTRNQNDAGLQIEKNWLVWQCTMVLMYAPVLFSGRKIKMREPDSRNIEHIREEHVCNEFMD